MPYSRQLEDDVNTKNHQFERLNDQLLQRESSEASLRSKKKDLKVSIDVLKEDKHKLSNEKLDLERDNQELSRRTKTVSKPFEVVVFIIILAGRCAESSASRV